MGGAVVVATADRDDEADARLILAVARALRDWRRSTGAQPPTKRLREAVWFFWQQPRLERPLVRRKYPRDDAQVVAALTARLEVVVVTTAESRLLPDAGTPAERYRNAGLDLEGFAPLDD